MSAATGWLFDAIIFLTAAILALGLAVMLTVFAGFVLAAIGAATMHLADRIREEGS